MTVENNGFVYLETIEVEGVEWSSFLTVLQSDGVTPMNRTGYVETRIVLSKKVGGEVVATYAQSGTPDASVGEVELTVALADTLAAGRYWQEWTSTPPGGDEEPVAHGPFVVQPRHEEAP